MLRVEAMRDHNVLVIIPDGPLESADFKFLVKEISPILASKGKLAGVIVRTESFPGWRNVGATACHLNFIRAYQHQIDRVALVTSSTFLRLASRVAHFVVKPQIRSFGLAESDQALAWLEEDRGQTVLRRTVLHNAN